MLREVLFSPGNITERKNCYDRYEPLKKPAPNPVMTAQMPWEKGGICWGSFSAWSRKKDAEFGADNQIGSETPRLANEMS